MKTVSIDDSFFFPVVLKQNQGPGFINISGDPAIGICHGLNIDPGAYCGGTGFPLVDDTARVQGGQA